MNFKAVLPLIALMGATRVHHFGDAFSLPDASLAAFFLAGLFFSSRSVFVVLLIEAALLDYVAIAHFNVSDFCISTAYVFLIPTYFVMWFGGRLCAAHETPLTLSVPTIVTLLVTTTSAFLISNGSFYLLSDNIPERHFSHYIAQLTRYYLPYTGYAFFYAVSGIAVVRIIKLLPALMARKAA